MMTPIENEAMHAQNYLSCHFLPWACWIYGYIASHKVVMITTCGDKCSTSFTLLDSLANVTYSYYYHFTKSNFGLSNSLIWNNCIKPHASHEP